MRNCTRMTRVLPVLAFAACGVAESPPARDDFGHTGTGIAFNMGALSYPEATDVCYSFTVVNGLDQLVVGRGLASTITSATRNPAYATWGANTPYVENASYSNGSPLICSTRFGNGPGGDWSYVAPCDASDDARDHTVTVWLDRFEAGTPPAELTSGIDYQDPCPAGCSVPVTCQENADTPVTFNFTIMRRANQGFFDIGVNFDNIFCSAKVDCLYGPGRPIELLFDPATDTRGQTAVLALACTTGPATSAAASNDTALLLNPVVVICNGDFATLNPAIPEGNGFNTTNPDPNPDDAIWQYAVYHGDEALDCGEGSCNKRYWNVAIGFDPTTPNCTVTTSATAVAAAAGGFGTPLSTNYPVIAFDVTLTDTNGALVCNQHPLNGADGAVATQYTTSSEQRIFAHRRDEAVISTDPAEFDASWSRAFGPGTTGAQGLGQSVATDAAGNIYTGAAFTNQAVSLGGALLESGFPARTSPDGIVAKYTATGEHVWSVRFIPDAETSRQSGVNRIAVAPDGDLVVVGSYSGGASFAGVALPAAPTTNVSGYAMRLDPATGAPRWVLGFPANAATSLNQIAFMPNGELVLTGATLAATIDLGGGPLASLGAGTDMFMLVLSPTGNHLASRRWGGSVAVGTRAVVVDGEGHATVAVTLGGGVSVDFGGGPLTTAGTSPGIGLVQFALTSSAPSTVDITWRWNKSFGSPTATATPWGLDVADNGDVVLAGAYLGIANFDPPDGAPLAASHSAGQADAFIARYTADGDHLWSFKWLGFVSTNPDISHTEATNAISILPSGNIAITGRFQGVGSIAGLPISGSVNVGNGNGDAVIALLTPSGQGIWAMVPVNTGTSNGIHVTHAPNGNVIAIGNFLNTADFGHGPLHRSGVTGTYQFLASIPESGPSPVP